MAAAVASGGDGHAACRRSTDTSSESVATPCTPSPRANAASWTSTNGTTRPGDRAASARASIPGTWRNEPLRPSSPQKARPSPQSGGRSPVATSNPTAMGRSSPAPALRTPEGARFTVTRDIGQGRPLESTAARTRSRASRTAASGRPTMVNPGRPFVTWTSTETAQPMAPLSVAEVIAANMPDERSSVGRIRCSQKFFVQPEHHGEGRTSRAGVYVRNGVPRLCVYARHGPAYTRRRKDLPFAWSLSDEGHAAAQNQSNVPAAFAI